MPDSNAALEKAYKKKKKEHDKCAEQLDESRKEFQTFEREDIKHREELKHLKTQLKKAHAGVEKDTKKAGEVQAERHVETASFRSGRAR